MNLTNINVIFIYCIGLLHCSICNAISTNRKKYERSRRNVRTGRRVNTRGLMHRSIDNARTHDRYLDTTAGSSYTGADPDILSGIDDNAMQYDRYLAAMSMGTTAGRTIYAYPDVVGGIEQCLMDDAYPDFMTLPNNIKKHLFQNIGDCCLSNEYTCTEAGESPLLSETTSREDPVHAAPPKMAKSEKSPSPSIDSLAASTPTPSVSYLAPSTNNNTSSQNSYDSLSSSTVTNEAQDTSDFPLSYLALIVPLVLLVVASMFYRAKRKREAALWEKDWEENHLPIDPFREVDDALVRADSENSMGIDTIAAARREIEAARREDEAIISGIPEEVPHRSGSPPRFEQSQRRHQHRQERGDGHGHNSLLALSESRSETSEEDDNEHEQGKNYACLSTFPENVGHSDEISAEISTCGLGF